MSKSLHTFIIIALVITNCLTIAYFSNKSTSTTGSTLQQEETVAKIGDVSISREDWMVQLEERYGKDTLREMVNDRVVEQLAVQYGIEVNEDEVAREVSYFLSMYGMSHSDQFQEEEWKEEMKRIIVLEELLTKDVTIPEEEMERYYSDNQHLFTVPDTYHLSHIIVNTKEDAEQTIQELEDGSSFSVLAMEKSIDEFTAVQGGNLGFVSLEDHMIPSVYEEIVANMETETWSEPIQMDNEYAIVYLHEKIEGKSWSYEEVKEQIRRKIALDQMQTPISASEFWDELHVEWFYGEQSES
ncbi:peptidyl-prolyl cis-trans isomerase [Bacillus carboniphilus]|uniref:peptidylprolyl isomerase n=1 Tax=Bacillus carboniphilus TaxID=86663 RepID=A0ABP3FPV6_9BACI